MTEADFTGDVSLTKLAKHRFKLDDDEQEVAFTIEQVLKILKVMMYKIGICYKRQEVFRD